MSQQYNSITSLYMKRRLSSKHVLEKKTVKSIVGPYIKGAKVLELACGFGFYTYDLVDWGADSIVGVDVSSGMLEASRCLAISHGRQISKVQLELGNVFEPTAYPNGPFDIVFGGWMLNYAPDLETLTQTFRNINLNLRPGGLFVGITCPPAKDPESWFSAGDMSLGEPSLIAQLVERVDDGIKLRIKLRNDGDDGFECYYLRQDVHEVAAKAAGLSGQIQWKTTKELNHHDLVDDGSPERKRFIEEMAENWFSAVVISERPMK
ncbi:uncharacterized protein LOC100899908 [Galendromus occidentalis]|uniref:Uncharacterized protein LOC100899908 n=1 Tax=Galendromus occidentalis TaxID=34638 RepID=A0AAJ6QLS8_9ACAR|nr:uncharacterized protein LOC100899908 [Galendromus occidentalis]